MFFELKERILNSVKVAVKNLYGFDCSDLEMTFPPNPNLGHLAVSCFAIAKEAKKSPAEVALKLGSEIKKDKAILEIKPFGPYLNMTLDKNAYYSAVLNDVIKSDNSFWHKDLLKEQKIMVEYLSPNTNKPITFGHIRNGALGMAVANILEAVGAKVIKAKVNNDRGIHIMKSVLAWQKWGKDTTPESMGMKGDHFVGYYYVMFCQKAKLDLSLEREAQALLQKWEAGDSEVKKDWELLNSWVYEGFNETFKNYNFIFDKDYFESKYYLLGKEIVKDGLRRGTFKKGDDGSIVAFLDKKEFGLEKDNTPKKTTLIRKDGTSVYMTQDLGLAKLKEEDFDLNQSIYVVGNEQDYHFKVLFNLLKQLGLSLPGKLFHMSYGLVYLPEGKMKSREGKVVDADDFLLEMSNQAKEEIKKREQKKNINEDEIVTRSLAVADAAIKYYLLSYSPKQNIHFDPKASLSFDGSSGPYLQYTYARAKSILKKADSNIDQLLDNSYELLTSKEESLLVQKALQFSTELEKSAQELNPAKIALALFEIAKAFNQFYQKLAVLNIDDEKLKNARLALVFMTQEIIKRGLNILNIKVLEEM